MRQILVINTGSTSTKVAVFRETQKLCEENIAHSAQELAAYASAQEQIPMRIRVVRAFLQENGYAIGDFSAVAARGGSFAVFQAGAYLVDEAMLYALRHAETTPGAAALSCVIADELAREAGIPAYIYDAVSVDEMEDIAHISGLPQLPRRAAAHTLNTKAVARMAAQRLGSSYEEMNFVIVHLGGGISTTAHRCGRIVDLVADDEGTFSPERPGKVPCSALIDLCYSGAYTRTEAKRLMRGKGGLTAYLDTNSCQAVEARIAAGDREAERVYQAMAYQIAKDVASMAAALSFQVDRILLTGGIARSAMLTGMIRERVERLAPVETIAGSFEMEALAAGVLRVLDGRETAKRLP